MYAYPRHVTEAFPARACASGRRCCRMSTCRCSTRTRGRWRACVDRIATSTTWSAGCATGCRAWCCGRRSSSASRARRRRSSSTLLDERAAAALRPRRRLHVLATRTARRRSTRPGEVPERGKAAPARGRLMAAARDMTLASNRRLVGQRARGADRGPPRATARRATPAARTATRPKWTAWCWSGPTRCRWASWCACASSERWRTTCWRGRCDIARADAFVVTSRFSASV